MKEFTLQYRDEDVFVDVGGGYLMCIGKRSEVAREDAIQITERIYRSLARRRYYAIDVATERVVH